MGHELILIVEDNEMNQMLLEDALAAQGYRVLVSLNAEEGLIVARQQQPALILMDIGLPGMDGIEALRKLKDDPGTRNTPVIAVTASAMPAERKEILAAGFDGYQAKPISVRDLWAEVRRLLDGSAPGDDPTTPRPTREDEA